MRSLARVVGALVLLLPAAACGGDGAAEDVPAAERPSLAAQIVQLRRDEVLERVEVSLRNEGPEDVMVEQLTLRVPGFRSAGPVPKDSLLRPGLVVNLPTPYGEVRCSRDGRARVGRPVVTLRLHTSSRAEPRQLVLRPGDPDGVLDRVAARECTERRVRSEIGLSFGDRWRPERTADGVVLRGTLEARLRAPGPRDVTQVAGTVIYSLRPATAQQGDRPLARLTPENPAASVPVVVSVARCDGHARGETKKPYEFLVWVAAPGGEEVAVSPVVDDADRAALQAVCPL
jgi:hypothetical protein